jgi:hypothetical protein
MSHRSTKTSLRFYLLAAALWLSATPATAQQSYPWLPPRALVGNMTDMTNPQNTVTLPELVAALSSFGVMLDKLTTVGDSIYTIDPSARTVATSAPLSASRTWTLPGASFVNAGHTILIVDLAGGVSATNTLVISRAGADTINGDTSVTINAAYGAYYLVSDGSRAWIAQPLGGIAVTPGGGLVSSASGACAQSAITAFGTLSAAQCINAQTGTTYAILDGDRAKLITASNAAAQAYSIAQAGTASAFQSGWFVDIHNISTNPAGIVTVTPTTSTVDGASTLPIFPGQSVRIVSDGANYQTVNRQLSNATTNSLSGDVALNNTANYFDGPSMAQGTSGTWRVSGTVTLQDTTSAAQFYCKLWDGTTVIASSGATSVSSSSTQSMSLSGALATPAANIRISCRDITTTTGKIIFNQTGNSKDSSIFGHRIQ